MDKGLNDMKKKYIGPGIKITKVSPEQIMATLSLDTSTATKAGSNTQWGSKRLVTESYSVWDAETEGEE